MPTTQDAQDDFERALAIFIDLLAITRGRFGRDYIRSLPLGETLDALDSGAADLTREGKALDATTDPAHKDVIEVTDG